MNVIDLRILIVLLAISIGLFRVAGYKSQAFQAIAHLLVGGA